MSIRREYSNYAMNPYLASKEYIPDGEPHVFDERVYIFGSHDRFDGDGYCQEPYVAWSASVHNLNDWRYEGVILEKGLDPLDPAGLKSYYAPDVAKGVDGRYYLYYSIEESSVISVAVSETPAGKYRFYGHVKDKNGHILGTSEDDPFQFDPAVLVDEEKIYLYSGQNTPVPGIEEGRSIGSLVCELEPDMVTVKTKQKVITSGLKNCFSENPFFEASSIRKFGNQYYFIYSPLPNVHNLCYAVSDRPDGDFQYGGVLVSNADIFEGVPENKTMNYWGNNHGSIAEILGEFYIFYHRHTNKSGWCRQACAEKLKRNEDGSFVQAELTSTGLSGDCVPAKGRYGAYTACHLRQKNMSEYQPFQFQIYGEDDPYFTQEEETSEQYIANLRDGANADFRYFEFTGKEQKIEISCRGTGKGIVKLYEIGQEKKFLYQIAEIKVEAKENWSDFQAEIQVDSGKKAIRIQYEGSGYVDLLAFEIE